MKIIVIFEHTRESEQRVKLGTLLASAGRKTRLDDDEFATLEGIRDRSLAKTASVA